MLQGIVAGPECSRIRSAAHGHEPSDSGLRPRFQTTCRPKTWCKLPVTPGRRRFAANMTPDGFCASIGLRLTRQVTRSSEMQLSVGLVLLGALLILGGVLVTAGKALSRGRLSEPRGSGQASANHTLEPRKPSVGLSLGANWKGIALIALGSVLLLSAAII